jgi:hypothetical protein
MLFIPKDMNAQPEVVISRWQLYEIAGNFDGEGSTFHIVGEVDGYGRTSSPIKEFIKNENGVLESVITRSGRKYFIEGEPGRTLDATWVFDQWLRNNKNPEVKNITEEYFKYVPEEITEMDLKAGE